MKVGVNRKNNVFTKFSQSFFRLGSYRTSLYSILFFSVFFSTPEFGFFFHKLYWNVFFSAKTEMAASLQLNKTANVSSIISGETFVYTLQYRCASLTDDCLGTVITDPLPAGVEFVSVLGSSHTTNESYDSGSHTVTFTFVNTLTAGITGQVQIQVRFPNGTTPNGAVASNTASISATNASTVSSTADVTASATDRLTTHKYYNGGVVDKISMYGIEICNNTSYGLIEDGTMNPTNITVIDTLPAGTIFSSANNSGVYNAVDHSVTWTFTDIDLGDCEWPQVFLTFPSSNFSTGDLVSNTATITYTPIGTSPITERPSVSHNLATPLIQGRLEKESNDNTVFPGQSWGRYTFEWSNWSNVEVPGFYLQDTLPDDIRVTDFNIGQFYVNGPFTNLDITVTYTTNLNSTPTVVPGSPFGLYDNTSIDVSTLGLAANEYLTKIRWDFGPDPMPISAGLNSNGLIEIEYTISSTATPGEAINCLEAGGSSDTYVIAGGDNCDTITIEALATTFKPRTRKDYASPSCGGCYSYSETGDWISPGDTVNFRLRIGNSSSSGVPIPDPSIADLLPIGLDYIAGTWVYDDDGSGIAAPTFTTNSNYNGLGRELLKWEWPGVNLPPNENVYVTFDAIVSNEAPTGEDALTNKYYVLQYDDDWCSASGLGGREADVYDLDNDGDITDYLCTGYLSLDIAAIPSLESEKLVKGQLDANWTKYPATGNTVPGGLADYNLVVKNTGNIALDSIIVIDILPFVGDQGVIDLSNRNSRWRPNLVGAVSTPSGVTVYYSTEGNPCRSAEGIVPSGPSGCTAASWTTIPPSNISSVQSLKFDFGATVLNPGDSLQLEWPMRAPVNVMSTLGALPDSIAWNSFGYIGQRVDNSDYLLASEPVKVGIDMNLATPGVIGDFVWIDDDQDGIQDAVELGIDGVRVEIYLDNGDGIANPNTDTYQEFTLTADGGYYLFPNLPADDYFLVFYLPPTYDFSNPNQGGDDTKDSDGNSTTFNGFEVAITAVTSVSAVEYDYDWDQGVYPSNNGAVGNYVWHDLNNNGVQDESSVEGVNGLVINIYDNSNPTVIYSTTSTVNDAGGFPGYYLFDDLPPGNYFLEFVLPSSTTFSVEGSTGSSDPTDSDANTSTGRTEVFAVLANTYDDSWDAGIILSGTEDCTNGIDDDGDGLSDCEDPDCNLIGYGSNWFFGQNAALNFEHGSGPIQISPSSMNTDEGCASFSDEFGNLLFYTNGIDIWNAEHNVMPNGGGLSGHPSSTQSGVIVPDPSNSNRYYIFSLYHQNGNAYYSVVDMTLDSGRGDVVVGLRDINIPGSFSEKLAAWPHTNGIDFWVTLVPSGGTVLQAYPLTTSGLGTPVANSITSFDRLFGQMKFNADGSILALASYPLSGTGQVELYDFDKSTGTISNPRIWSQAEPYGLEFSPSGQILYITEFGWSTNGQIHQYQLQGNTTGAAINATKITILTASSTYSFASLQLAPDRKIYMASSIPMPHIARNGLSVINDPDNIGAASNPVEDQFTFTGGAMSRSGLPNFPAFQVLQAQPTVNYADIADTCIGTARLLTYSASALSYQWLLDGNPIVGATDSVYTPTVGGDYQVVAYFTCLADTSEIFSGPVNCVEICGNDLDDDGDGLIDCEDPDCSPITLSNLAVSACIDHPLLDVATLTVDVAWLNAPPSEIIEVSIFGKTEYIDVDGGASSPQSINFTIPADGTSGEITTSWRNNGSACTDTISYTAPVACSTDTIACDILYLCGETKPSDGDAWDHGYMDYLDKANGNNPVTAALVKPDGSGIGIYDPNNPTTLLPINFQDYSLIFISSTTEGQVAGDLIDSLKTYTGSILNTNYLLIDDLGMSASAGSYSFQGHAYTDNTTQTDIYNFNNLNAVYSILFTRGNYLASADAYLWTGAGDQVAVRNGIYFHYTENDVLPGIASHGSRTYLGYHMNGVYHNPVNGGATPAPVASWFSPSRHLTLEGKVYFDQAILSAGLACNTEICNNSIDDDGDDLTDCDDPDCIESPTINRSLSSACVNETIVVSSSDIGGTTTYTWDFGTNASPASAIGIGPHNVSYTSCGAKTISLTVEKNACSITVDSIVNIIDNTDPVWDTNPQDLIMECVGSANYPDSISQWLNNNGNGVVSDNCAAFKISNNYSGLSSDCGSTESTIVQFTATDSCGNSAIQTAQIQILDTNAPSISSVNDLTVDCESVPATPSPSVADSCDASPDLVYQEVLIQHPTANWSSSVSCTLLYEVSSGVFDDKGTPATSDDEMSFVLTVIGQNTGANWNATIGGSPESGAYYESIEIGPFLSDGAIVNFTIVDSVDGSCSVSVALNGASF